MVLQQADSRHKLKKIAPSGPPALPLVGMLPFLSKHLHLELNQLAKKYGNIFQIHVGARTLVVLSGFETIKEALVTQHNNFNSRADFSSFQQSPQCEFPELKSGEPAKRHRNIINQVMHTFVKPDRLEDWLLEEVADLTDIFLKFGGKPFDPELYLPLANLSFMQRLMFGKRGTVEDTDFVKTAHILKELPNGLLNVTKTEILPQIWRPIFQFFHQKSLQAFPKGLGMLNQYISKNLEQHRESFDPENLRDLADGLLKASNELTESDLNKLRLSEYAIVNGTLIQFAGAAGEVPSIMLRWALLYMITYPGIQAEIQKELDEVVGREQQPSLIHRARLPFTEACINEILRHSSATVMPPVTYATTADTVLEGYFIPKNTPLLVNYYGLTRDERYWKDPEKFNPYRFLDENGKLKNDLVDRFCPFGMGSRRCLGENIGRLQIFIFFTNLMHRCKFEKPPREKLSFKSHPAAIRSPENCKAVVKPRF